MHILFLGVSSFSGYHFIKKLSENKKNKIICTLTKKLNSYKSIRYERIKLIKKIKNIQIIEKIKFGDEKFINLLKKKKFNVICLHHALTKNYNSNTKFNLKKSLTENTKNINLVFSKIDKKCKIVISNTIFQNIPSKRYKAVNNYGISKSRSYEKIKLSCKKFNLKYKSIYITNPWGPLEEKKLNYYLITNWIQNKKTFVSHPNYIRDNIFIDKLTKYYYKIVNSNSKKIEYFPSGYCSTNKIFIESFKNKFEKFFNKKLKLSMVENQNIISQYVELMEKKINKKIIISENLDKYFLSYKNFL